MSEKHSSNFLIGFGLGLLLCALAWYWQKSTAADEGALDLLDRMAAMERRLRRSPAETAARAEPAEQPDDLEQVHGIGPVFAGRLQREGINTLAGLTAVSAERLAAVLDVGVDRAAAILAAARGR